MKFFAVILGILLTFSQPAESKTPCSPENVNGHPTSIVFGKSCAPQIVQIYLGPTCAHCGEFIPELLQNPSVQEAIKKGNLCLLLSPVAFYQKLDTHIIALCSAAGEKSFWDSLKIFLNPEFQELFNIKDALLPEEHPEFSLEILDGILIHLEKYLKRLQTHRSKESLEKKDVRQERLVRALITLIQKWKRIKDPSLFFDVTFLKAFNDRRQDITEKDVLSVPKISIWKSKQWTKWTKDISVKSFVDFLKSSKL